MLICWAKGNTPQGYHTTAHVQGHAEGIQGMTGYFMGYTFKGQPVGKKAFELIEK